MHNLPNINHTSKSEMYADLLQQTRALLEGESDFIANLANVSSLIYHTVPNLNWAGFYLMKEGELVLGPFQGKPACVRIKSGSGVCGTAAATQETQIVKDVHEFPGHIACDSASNSEIVVPMIKNGEVIGVLDVDSPELGNFDEEDRQGLVGMVEVLLGKSDC